jgi:predicted amidohydrolase YtcJ
LADVQPSFVASDHAFLGERLGEERTPYAYCFQTLLRSGVHLAGGSDCPIESCNPLLGIHAAVTRTDPRGEPLGGWMPQERLTLAQALHMFTLGSACCTYEEKQKGTLAPGKWADLAVLSEDLRQVEPAAIKEVQVLMTMVGGEIRYRAF